jgi:uncharacterized Zn-binding protein involved in type VI secretion
MGKPAARLGDMTAHGGTITGPGCPTVLIGGMPAATMGDMHVCPMVTPGTPPIPHVGGPITLGSMGVLIGGKPAARMGDMAVCVGPPSSIILGCMTVLIGEAGGGGGGGGAGAGGAGAGGTGTAGALHSAAIAGSAPKTEDVGDHYLDVGFVDSANLPVGGMRYVLSSPSGAKSAGIMGGGIKLTGVAKGDYTVTLRAIANAQWSTGKSDVGTAATMQVDAIGVEDGEKAILDIYVRDGNYTDHLLDTVEAEVRNGQVRQKWTMKVDEKYLAMCSAKEKKKKYSRPFFFFKVKIGELAEQSGILFLKDWLEIEVKDDWGKAVGNRKYSANLPTGEIRQGTLDSNGKAKLENIPPGKINISLK